MLHIGCHLSTAKGYLAMAREAVDLQADTFAFFTRNPRGGKGKDIDQKDVDAFLAFSKEHHFVKLVAHAPYTMNLCAAKEDIRTFAQSILIDDLARMEKTPGNYYNLHPGNHVGQGIDAGIAHIADALNRALSLSQTTTVLLETMAGKGSEVGRSFAEIRNIIDKVALHEKIGVCLDTCHVWDGGYDIVHHLNDVLDDFDRTIGLDRLKAIHLNDSLNACGSHKDRHAKIGKGNIGLDALTDIINHPKLRDLPFILETPNDHDGYAREIALLRARFLHHTGEV